jgi:hypothetical protein
VSEVSGFIFMAVCFAVIAIAALGLGSRQMPREISTFARSTDAERTFDQRSTVLMQTGFVSLAFAVAAGATALLLH